MQDPVNTPRDSIARSELRKDFEESFPNLDFTLEDKYVPSSYVDHATLMAWCAWVGSFETYVGRVRDA